MCKGIVKTPSNEIDSEEEKKRSPCEPTTSTNYTHVSPIHLMDFVKRIHFILNTHMTLPNRKIKTYLCFFLVQVE